MLYRPNLAVDYLAKKRPSCVLFERLALDKSLKGKVLVKSAANISIKAACASRVVISYIVRTANTGHTFNKIKQYKNYK
ncbi:hypothetical protein OAG1_17920 [Agarivorans sp. OAG1]|nr:hypothetical protein OAG1_17920 [Agarivorans sp. OAG1]